MIDKRFEWIYKKIPSYANIPYMKDMLEWYGITYEEYARRNYEGECMIQNYLMRNGKIEH